MLAIKRCQADRRGARADLATRGPKDAAAGSAQARVAEPVDGAGVLSAPVSYSAGRCTSVTFTSTETTSSPVPYSTLLMTASRMLSATSTMETPYSTTIDTPIAV